MTPEQVAERLTLEVWRAAEDASYASMKATWGTASQAERVQWAFEAWRAVLVEAITLPAQHHRRACECREPDPVQQADGKFYCYTCSFETGARPQSLRDGAALRPPPATETCKHCGLARANHPPECGIFEAQEGS